MTYRSLLVLLDQAPVCVERTRVAIRLAQAMGCHLVGLAPTGLVDMPALPEAAASMAEFAELAWRTLRDQAQQSMHRFQSACQASGLKSFEALVDESDTAMSVVRHAHCSDLVILTQADDTAPGAARAREFVEKVVLHSARPSLLLPCAGRVDTVATNVLVAWDDSREATRALSDALPLLRRAQRVQVIGWREKGMHEDSPSLQVRLNALKQWLMWQGVSAEVGVEATQIDVAGALLSRATDLGADLIVMGAYGHARWTERLLGGATRGLLHAMTVPVLMSH